MSADNKPTNNKLMDMLTGYAAAHQHPFNIFVHMIGIPTIMLGALIPLTWSWAGFSIGALSFSLAHIVMLGFFAFYLTLDRLFAIVYLTRCRRKSKPAAALTPALFDGLPPGR